MRALPLMVIVGCAAIDAPTPAAPLASPPPAPIDAGAPLVPDAAPTAPPVTWLKGSTHVHARPSGDSSEPIADVIHWYEARGYDFIVLTDHNKVSELDATSDTTGQPVIRAPGAGGLLVFAGSELTHNPSGCVPAGDASKKCRIHVNAIGATARPHGKIDWTPPIRKTHDRVAKYQAALDEAAHLGAALTQVNHPQWFWGMTPEVLTTLAQHGVRLVEIANAQFPQWNAGDKTHPSMEQLWDAALGSGATLWGVASDDAHDYHGHGKWPPGGGWIAVRAPRDPQAILDALAAGAFYASSGVTLAHAEPVGGELVVEVAAGQPGAYTITWIQDGKPVDVVHGASARRAIPPTGYLRADVARDDGARAWVQPVRAR